MIRRFCLVLAIICIVLTACHAVTSIEKVEVSGTVTQMQYEKDFVRYNPALKMSQLYPEQYLVTITYEDISETFDNQTLYEKVKEGDTVQIILCNGYDEERNLVWQGLELPEQP